MLKRIISILIILVLTFAVAGCGSSNITDNVTDSPEQEHQDVKKTSVVGIDGIKLGEIDSRANCTAIKDGIFYSIFAPAEYHYTADAEYHFFNMNTGKDVLLGKLEDQGYEASYTRTELDGTVYTLAVKGNPMSDTAVPLVLLISVPGSGTMKMITVSDNGFPYAAMSVSNGKLLIMNHEMTDPKCDKIYEYDPAEETVKEVLSFSSDRDSLRGVSGSDSGFYILRLRLNPGSENELFIDKYDNNYVKISEESVNECFINAVAKIHGITGRSDALNELGMNVARFSVLDDRYAVYENFGLVRLLIDLQTGEELFIKEDIYTISVGNGNPVLYRMDFDIEDASEPYIAVFKDGHLVNKDYKATETHKLINTVSASASGTWLVLTSDGRSIEDRTYLLQVWTE